MDAELQKIIEQASKLKALHRARARVRELERELAGGPVRPEEPRYIPEFLRPRLPLRVARLVTDQTPPARKTAPRPSPIAIRAAQALPRSESAPEILLAPPARTG